MHSNTASPVATHAPHLRNAEAGHRPVRRLTTPSAVGAPTPRPGTTYGTVPGRAAYWAQAVGRTLGPVEVRPKDPDLFTGEIALRDYGYLRMCTLDAAPHRISATGRHGGDGQHMLVVLQASGTGLLSQNGRRMSLSPGDTAFVSTDGGLSLEFPEPSLIHLVRLPRTVLPVSPADLSAVLATVIRPTSGLGAVVFPFLSAIVRTEPEWAADVGDRVAGHVTDVLATLITEHAASARAGARAVADPGVVETGFLMARIRAHISQHLSDPGLSPRSIAAAHHISVRHLHWLFSREATTVGTWIRERRLEQAARELARPGHGKTISCIAHRWGFISANHFSRVFRQRYGVSPRTWRDSFASGRAPLSAIAG
ncbi:helix-turn-helix domain-containing protein [Streptomyces goshikiensis]|uniref:AraC-like ligand-binding domain-containing protein n=1 Tax=Streptomyces goshikiensis TaxID=1942 RepID=UPI00364AABD9